jgi:hypothetical protein
MATQQEGDADVFLASVAARESDSIFALLGDPELDFGCRPALQRLPDRNYQVYVFATERKLDELRNTSDLTVTVVRNESVETRRRQEEVGKGDRFEGGKIVPRGFGHKLRSGTSGI